MPGAHPRITHVGLEYVHFFQKALRGFQCSTLDLQPKSFLPSLLLVSVVAVHGGVNDHSTKRIREDPHREYFGHKTKASLGAQLNTLGCTPSPSNTPARGAARRPRTFPALLWPSLTR